MQFSKYALDMMATKLSEFNGPNIPELTIKSGDLLGTNMLESVLGVFSGDGNTHVRNLITNHARRIFAAIEFYNMGRDAALKYSQGPRDAVVKPYFLALSCFESAISYAWQVCDLINASIKGKAKVFEKGDGSGWEKLHAIYTVGTKHSHAAYDITAMGEVPTTVWLTNTGIECIDGNAVSFADLAEMIQEHARLYFMMRDAAANKIRAKRNAAANAAN